MKMLPPESTYLNRVAQNTEFGDQLLDRYYRTDTFQHRVVGGHDIILFIGDTAIGRAQAITGTRDFGLEQVYELGSMKPREFVPMRYNGSLTLERYLIREDDLVSVLNNTDSFYGGPTLYNAPFSLSDEGKILLHSIAGISIKVRDRYSNANAPHGGYIRIYNNCVFASYDEDFRAGALSGERATVYYTEVVTPTDAETTEA